MKHAVTVSDDHLKRHGTLKWQTVVAVMRLHSSFPLLRRVCCIDVASRPGGTEKHKIELQLSHAFLVCHFSYLFYLHLI